MESSSTSTSGSSKGSAQAVWGLQSTQIDSGTKVSDVRNTFGAMWRIPEDSQPFVNGAAVDKDYELKAGDNLEFIRRAGEKG